MSEPCLSDSQIFRSAARLTGQERANYLHRACGGDERLRAEVESLLRAHDLDGSFLSSPAAVVTIDRPVTEQVGTLIGPYKLLEQIGEGGMGVVYMAEQQQPVRRLVALKLVKPGMDTKQVIARFEAERQALAMMDHPNIARIFDAGMVGETQNSERRMQKNDEASPFLNSEFCILNPAARPYFVMELVRGIPLNDFCDQKQLSLRERLELFIDVCQAVQHAHQKGIIHRDLKPTNVLVTMADAMPVPKVIDFGVAKALGQSLTDHTLHTGYSQLVGTPLYMSPEQAEMNLFGVDTRSDVYSLGVMLYELLTGTTPFDKERLKSVGFDEMRRIIREEEPETVSNRIARTRRGVGVSPAQSSHHTPYDVPPASFPSFFKPKSKIQNQKSVTEFDWIVMKSLEKDRTRRYESASALAADIQRYLSDEPVLACPPTTMYRFQKFARKHKASLTTAAAIAVCLILGTTVSAWQAARATTAEAQANANAAEARDKAKEATDQRDDAQKQRDEVKSLADRLQRTLYEAHMKLAKQAWDEAIVPRALDLLETYRAKLGEPDLRGFEWHYLYRLCHADAPLTITARDFYLQNTIFSPDGTRVVSSSAGSSNSAVEPELKFWDAQTGMELLKLRGNDLGAGGMIYSPDGKRIAVILDKGMVKILDARGGQELVMLKGHTALVLGTAFSPDGKRLATACPGDKTVRVWDSESGEQLLSFTGSGRDANFPAAGTDFYPVAFSPDGKRLAHGMTGVLQDGKRAPGEVKVRDAQTGQEILSLPGGGGSVAFSADGQRIASRTGRGWYPGRGRLAEEVQVWNAQTGKEIESLNEKSDLSVEFAFSPDGKRLAVAGERSKAPRIKVSDTETGKELFTFQRHGDEVMHLAFSRDSKLLATASRDRTVQIWDLESGLEIRKLKGHTDAVYSVDFSPDGKRLATASSDGTIKIWDLQKAPDTLALEGRRTAISPDFKRLATVLPDHTIKIWDAKTGKEMLTLVGHTEAVMCLAFSPDGSRIASGDGDLRRTSTPDNPVPGVVKIWDAQTGRELRSLKGLANRFVAFSPDGKRLASLSWPRELKIWDVTSGAEVLTIKSAAGGRDASLVFSSDGKRVALGGKIWDAVTGQEILSPPGSRLVLAFSRDSKRMLSTSDRAGNMDVGLVRVCSAETGEGLSTLKGHTERVSSAAFSPDGKRVGTAAMDGTVKLWDSETGQELLSFGPAPVWIGGAEAHNITFSHDGHRLASTFIGTVKIYDATPLP